MRALADELEGDLSVPGTNAVEPAAMAELAKAGLSVHDTMTVTKGVLQ